MIIFHLYKLNHYKLFTLTQNYNLLNAIKRGFSVTKIIFSIPFQFLIIRFTIEKKTLK